MPALGVIVGLIVTRMRPLFRAMQARIDQINRVLREQITGVRVVRAFVRDDLEQQRFDDASIQLMTVSLGAGRLMAPMCAPSPTGTRLCSTTRAATSAWGSGS